MSLSSFKQTVYHTPHVLSLSLGLLANVSCIIAFNVFAFLPSILIFLFSISNRIANPSPLHITFLINSSTSNTE